MSTLRRYWLAIFFTAAGFVASGAMYGRLPPRIPVHLNIHGAVDGWMPKQEGAFVIPVVAFVSVRTTWRPATRERAAQAYRIGDRAQAGTSSL